MSATVATTLFHSNMAGLSWAPPTSMQAMGRLLERRGLPAVHVSSRNSMALALSPPPVCYWPRMPLNMAPLSPVPEWTGRGLSKTGD